MKKLFSILFTGILILTGVVFSTGTVLAQSTDTAGKLEPVDCFAPNLYRFQSVQVSAGPEKGTYQAGDTINFVGEVINENNYPVVDGYVFVRIGKINPDYITDGHNTVAEIMAVSNISVDASSSLPVSFTWTVPKDLGSGDYRADYFFSVGKKFNLGGLPFTNEIIIGFANFKIANIKETEFVLDRTGTKVNGVDYNHIGQWPTVAEGAKVEITQPVKNFTDKELKVAVTYDLYFWDSVNEADKLDSKTETVTVPAKSSKTLTYVIPKSEQSVYYLRIKATAGDASSIVNIRTVSNIEKARLNYPAINVFPLTKGDSVDLFSCFHTVRGVASSSKLILTLTDKAGKEVAKGEYDGTFSTDMTAASMKFLAPADYTFLNLKAELFNNQGQVVDSYQSQYDCSTLKSDKCEVMIETGVKQSTILYSLIVVLLSLLGLFVTTKHLNSSVTKKVLSISFIILLVLSLATLIWVMTVGVNKAGAVALVPESKTQTYTDSKTFTSKVHNNENLASVTIYDGTVATGDVGITNTVTMDGAGTLTGNPAMAVGDKITFSNSFDCVYNFSGGEFSTPYCGEYNRVEGTGSYAYLTWTNPPKPALTLTSSDPSILRCDSSTLECIALRAGSARVIASVASVSSVYKVRFYSILKDEWYCNYEESGLYKPCNEIKTGITVGLVRSSGIVDRSYNTYTFSAYKPTWDITVVAPDVDVTPVITNDVIPVLSVIGEPCKDGFNLKLTNDTSMYPGGYDEARDSFPEIYKNGTRLNIGSYQTMNGYFIITLLNPSPGASYTGSVHNAINGYSAYSNPIAPTLVDCPLTASCTVSPTSTTTGALVTWTATSTGGTVPYTYAWVGDGFVNGKTSASVLGSYSVLGVKHATTTIRSGAKTSTASCSNAVTIVATTSALSATCFSQIVDSGGDYGDVYESKVTASGGLAPYSYTWAPSSGVGRPPVGTLWQDLAGIGDPSAGVIVSDSSNPPKTTTTVVCPKVATPVLSILENSCNVLKLKLTYDISIGGRRPEIFRDGVLIDKTQYLTDDMNGYFVITLPNPLAGTYMGNISNRADYSANSKSIPITLVDCSALTASCTVSPASAKVDESVTWTATSTGGTGPYTYLWAGTNIGGFRTSQVTTKYATAGTYHATATVTDRAGRSVSAGCPGTASNSGSNGGGGVEITNTNNATCTDGSQNQGEAGVDCGSPCPNACSSTIPTSNSDLNCDLTTDAGSPINLNTKTIWTATPRSPISVPYHTFWKVTDDNNTTGVWVDIANNNTRNIYFGSLLPKIVSAYFVTYNPDGTLSGTGGVCTMKNISIVSSGGWTHEE